MTIQYLKPRQRMPVQAQQPIYERDIQQDIPVGWCLSCRQMLYSPEEVLCRRCKEETAYG